MGEILEIDSIVSGLKIPKSQENQVLSISCDSIGIARMIEVFQVFPRYVYGGFMNYDSFRVCWEEMHLHSLLGILV